jgi:hypothetical protein
LGVQAKIYPHWEDVSLARVWRGCVRGWQVDLQELPQSGECKAWLSAWAWNFAVVNVKVESKSEGSHPSKDKCLFLKQLLVGQGTHVHIMINRTWKQKADLEQLVWWRRWCWQWSRQADQVESCARFQDKAHCIVGQVSTVFISWHWGTSPIQELTQRKVQTKRQEE